MCSVYGDDQCQSEGEKPELNTRKWVTMADGLSSHFIPGQVGNVTTSETDYWVGKRCQILNLLVVCLLVRQNFTVVGHRKSGVKRSSEPIWSNPVPHPSHLFIQQILT